MILLLISIQDHLWLCSAQRLQGARGCVLPGLRSGGRFVARVCLPRLASSFSWLFFLLVDSPWISLQDQRRANGDHNHPLPPPSGRELSTPRPISPASPFPLPLPQGRRLTTKPAQTPSHRKHLHLADHNLTAIFRLLSYKPVVAFTEGHLEAYSARSAKLQAKT